MRTIATAVLVSAALAISGAARAATITFAGPIGNPVAPTVEGAFRYSTFSGGLFRDTEGNGDLFDMEGCSTCGGGVLDIVNVTDDLFTFLGADIAFQFSSAHDVTFAGYRLGNLIATDVFTTLDNSSYSTVNSVKLAGVAIDELRITLDAALEFATAIDNVRVQAVPEPATLALIGSGLLIVARRMRARQ
jgi:hypothetical protein